MKNAPERMLGEKSYALLTLWYVHTEYVLVWTSLCTCLDADSVKRVNVM